MTKEEYMKFHSDCCQKMIEVTKAKNADYTGTSDDPFFNFTRVEAVGIANTETGFLTRMFDKFARITTFVNKGVLLVKDESVEDTLIDLANYCILFAGYIKSKRNQPQDTPGSIRLFCNRHGLFYISGGVCPQCYEERNVPR